MEAMMASEGPPDRSTRLDSREALSAPTHLQYHTSQYSRPIQTPTIPPWRNTSIYNTHPCNTTADKVVAQYTIQTHGHWYFLQYHNTLVQYHVRCDSGSIRNVPTLTILWSHKNLCNTMAAYTNGQYAVRVVERSAMVFVDHPQDGRVWHLLGSHGPESGFAGPGLLQLLLLCIHWIQDGNCSTKSCYSYYSLPSAPISWAK